ncbi:prepilin-type N-terminal cleavage/methylation domain-containing protein [Planctomycetota bacterium]|nr:prepilin-type N-terminal cleavage/methylation domain-containing protein [Planctomycetota bacterium]
MKYAYFRDKAFTLLELLLSLGILSVLIISVYTSLKIAHNADQKFQNISSKSTSVQNALSLLKSDFITALPANGIYQGTFLGTNQSSYDAYDHDTVEFFNIKTCTNINAIDQFNIHKIEYTILQNDDNDDQYDLVRNTYSDHFSTIEIEPDSETIIENIAGFNLRYFLEYDWMDDWDSSSNNQNVPKAIEITLSIPDNKSEVKTQNYDLSSADNQNTTDYKIVVYLPAHEAISDANMSNRTQSSGVGNGQ